MDQDNVFNLKSVVYFVLIFNKNRLRDRPRKNKYGNYLLLHKLCLFVKKMTCSITQIQQTVICVSTTCMV